MTTRVNILSTRALSLSQISIFDTDRFNLTAVDFITTSALKFDVEAIKQSSKHWIISSKYTLNLILEHFTLSFLSSIHFYCVGQKTAQIIRDKGLNVIETETSSHNLSQVILKKHNSGTFSFLCGLQRREELPTSLTDNQVSFLEFNLYNTTLNSFKIEEDLDAIIFYSPSGVKSYVIENTINNEDIFCIGNTTATEAQKYSTNINIATEQTFESVLNYTKKHFS